MTSRNSLLALLLAAAPAAHALSLSEALELAKQHDPTVPVAVAINLADRQAAVADRALRRPTLAAGGNYSHATTESESNFFPSTRDSYMTWDAQVTGRQPLFRLDWFALGDRADARDRLAEISAVSLTQQLLRRVADRYFGAMLAQDQLLQAQAEEKAVRESLDDTQKRYDVELVAGTDLKEARARHDLARAQLFAARRAVENAQDALAETIGRRESLPRLKAEAGFPPLTPASAEAWVAAAREHSVEIATARENAIVARTQAATAAAETLPMLDIVGSAGRSDNSEYAVGQKMDDARIGVQMTVPLYNGGAGAAARNSAQARARAAEADLERITRETERATRTLYGEVETRYYEAEAFRRALESAEAAETATRHGYDAGTRTITDVLDAKSRTVQARRNLNQTRYNLLLGLLQLKQTVGSLSEADFAQIDQLLVETAEPAPTTSTNPMPSTEVEQ